MTQKTIQFGELETRALFALEEKEAGLVTSQELVSLLKISTNRANKLAWQLAKKNRLIRIKKGIYLFAPMKSGAKGHWSEEAMSLLSKLMGNVPYSISFWQGLNFHGLTEQIPVTIHVKSTKRMRDFDAFGAKFQFVKVSNMGEFNIEKIAEAEVKITTIEQVIIDCLAHPEYCGGISEVCKAIWEAKEKISYGKLETIAVKSNDAVMRRLGYLLELLNMKKIKARKHIGFRLLDPSRKKIGNSPAKSIKWGLFLNLTEKDLTNWKEA